MIVGIDLGTTNSAAAIFDNGETRLIPNALGDLLTPSAVAVLADGTTLVGKPALNHWVLKPAEAVTSFKRFIGTNRTIKIGRHSFKAEDMSAIVLRSLKEDIEAATGEEVTEAVITVPAYFNDKQRKATRRAGELAGLKVARLLNEPTAAALAFGIADKQDREPFLVFDLGGGTFDVSIVEMFDAIVEVRASSGDNRLGGDDFTNAIVTHWMEMHEFPSDIRRNLLEARLFQVADTARRMLTDQAEAKLALTLGDRQFELTITAEQFERLAEPLLTRLRDPILRSLRDSNLRIEALSDIVLVGGATRMPIIRKAITKMFGRFPNHIVHPDHAVAIGAAIQAGLVERNAALDEVRLTDICPFTLGVEVTEYDSHGRLRGGLFSPIISRNSPTPISRTNNYASMSDNQSHIRLNIYQGESREVANNIQLGTMEFPIPKKPAGQVSIDCRFTYDSSGLLDVDVTIPETGETRSMLIADDGEALTPEQLKTRREQLAALKTHPRDVAENQYVVGWAARLYEEFIDERREHIGRMLLQFEGVLETQDPREIETARGSLAAALEELERDYRL
ncbi:Hsp70 family protein [Sphingopyxis macrogoltabida]|uniref:2-alkenal reductase n=1 Tax=Sphingopyxis macrogoltabida TaxID=33050 RepID=A0A0N9UE81_SPHMC|nr:molecular chaperone HscC [Sphingopyxis macrogoltabida]ALH81705.1 2-alkenal reductase [Sphingopyxis macrogoltabida]